MYGCWPAEQIRAAERQLIARLPAGALMARAAHAVAVQAGALLGFRYGARVLLLVGAGDNGGDALLAGAELARAGCPGARRCWPMPSAVHAGGLAALLAAGGRVVRLADAGRSDLIVDGLVGIGAHGPLRAPLLPLVEHANSAGVPVLAVDLPSGVDPDTGAVAGPGRARHRHRLHGRPQAGAAGRGRPAARRCGAAGPARAARCRSRTAWCWNRPTSPAVIARPGPSDDKYTRGVVGVAAGSAAYPGAAQLCVGAARLAGVGAVRFAGQAAAEVVRRFPEVLVTDTVAEAGRVQAWTVGPGLGDGPDARSALRRGAGLRRAGAAWTRTGSTCWPESDELRHAGRTIRAERADPARPGVRAAVRRDRHRPDRGGPAGGRRTRRGGAAQGLRHRGGRARPGGAYLNPTGMPGLATAGSGDVLAGLTGSLLATGVEPVLAAAVGAWCTAGPASEPPRTARWWPVT